MCDCDELIAQTAEETYLAGVTFSGGDPFDQPEPFAYLAIGLKKHNINIWCYTGYTWEELLRLCNTKPGVKDLLEHVDTIVDGMFQKELMDDSIEFRGSSNQRIIDVKESLKQNKVVIDTRFK